jgi:hypothetical protein
MCKKAENPCPGCKKTKKADVAWLFFTDEERISAENSGNASSLNDAPSWPLTDQRLLRAFRFA